MKLWSYPLIGLVVLGLWWLFGVVIPTQQMGRASEGGARFGDQFGAAGALFSGAALVFMAFELAMQRREIRNQRKESRDGREDRYFFELLDLVVRTRDSVRSPGHANTKEVREGLDYFENVSTCLLSAEQTELDIRYIVQDCNKSGKLYERLAAKFGAVIDREIASTNVGAYFRVVYHALRFIERTGATGKEGDAERRERVQLLRAMLTPSESIVLFLNIYFARKGKWKRFQFMEMHLDLLQHASSGAFPDELQQIPDEPILSNPDSLLMSRLIGKFRPAFQASHYSRGGTEVEETWGESPASHYSAWPEDPSKHGPSDCA